MVTNRSKRGIATAASALLVLVEAPRGMATSSEVAQAIGSHPVVVRRLFGRLRLSGLVESRPGPTGGWAIAKDPSTVRLGDLYRAMLEPTAPPPSKLGELLAVAEQAYLAALDRSTLADLARQDTLRPHS